MYSYIRGSLEETGQGSIVVEAGGVGYSILIPASVSSQLPPTGTEIKVYTHFAVREDGQTLYGFLYKEDREMFRRLITVNGIGPKGALAVLSIMNPDDLRIAIATGDVKSISQAPGIGKKTAERIILDLRDKVAKEVSEGMDKIACISLSGSESGRSQGPVAEAIDALTMLGFSRIEAGRAVGAVSSAAELTTEEIIRQALKGIRQ